VRLRSILGRIPGVHGALRKFHAATDPVRRQVRFWDGEQRRVNGEVSQLFRGWRKSETQAHESNVVFDSYSGGDVIDVGAYEGWYAALLAPKARPGDRFLLLEPDHRVLPKLHRVAGELARTFPHVGFYVMPVAAGNGAAAGMTFPYGEAGHPRVESSGAEATGDSTVRIDDIVQALSLRPALLKIDVEGAEWFVLEGASRTLGLRQCSLMLEVHPKWQPAAVTPGKVHEAVERFGYVKTDIDAAGDVAWRELWRPAPSTNV
jgi:FkbM family methyltransferase